METHSVCQVIIVDWDSEEYAAVEASADGENWAEAVCRERGRGRNIHCFSHDAADTSGLMKWATQHGLTRTDVAHLMPNV
jgi:hypothetical protein